MDSPGGLQSIARTNRLPGGGGQKAQISMFSRSDVLSTVIMSVVLVLLAVALALMVPAAAMGQSCPPGTQCGPNGCSSDDQISHANWETLRFEAGWRTGPGVYSRPAPPTPNKRSAPARAAARTLDPAVVQVVWRSGSRTLRGTGTIVGILKSTPRVGAVLISGHGVRPGGTVSVTYAGVLYPARVVDRDDSADLALLLFNAPAGCHYYRIATDLPSKGTPVTWAGFADGSRPTNRSGPVHSHEESMLWVTGDVRPGMSGGPILSRLHGLVSIITEGVDIQCRTPAVPTHVRGPILSRLRDFLGCGRYAWVLEGCATPSTERPPVPDPVQPTLVSPSVDLAGVLAKLTALQEAIDNIQLQPGEKGDDGDPGVDGVDGNDGVDGEDGAPFDVARLMDEQIAALAKRLPPIYVHYVDEETNTETVEPILLGEGFTIRLFPPE